MKTFKVKTSSVREIVKRTTFKHLKQTEGKVFSSYSSIFELTLESGKTIECSALFIKDDYTIFSSDELSGISLLYKTGKNEKISSLWRKVSEELPPVNELVAVRVRNKNKPDGIYLYDVCYIDEETNSWGDRYHTWEDIIEWKFIK